MATNEFDKYGHLIRSWCATDCAEYLTQPKSGHANLRQGAASWGDQLEGRPRKGAGGDGEAQRRHRVDDGKGPAPSSIPPKRLNRRLNSAKAKTSGWASATEAEEEAPGAEEDEAAEPEAPEPAHGPAPWSSQRALLNYLLGQ